MIFKWRIASPGIEFAKEYSEVNKLGKKPNTLSAWLNC